MKIAVPYTKKEKVTVSICLYLQYDQWENVVLKTTNFEICYDMIEKEILPITFVD